MKYLTGWILVSCAATVILTGLGCFVNWTIHPDWFVVRLLFVAILVSFGVAAVSAYIDEDEKK